MRAFINGCWYHKPTKDKGEKNEIKSNIFSYCSVISVCLPASTFTIAA